MGTAKAARVVNIGIVEKGGPSSGIFVVDLHKKANEISSPKATQSVGFVETGDESSFK